MGDFRSNGSNGSRGSRGIPTLTTVVMCTMAKKTKLDATRAPQLLEAILAQLALSSREAYAPAAAAALHVLRNAPSAATVALTAEILQLAFETAPNASILELLALAATRFAFVDAVVLLLRFLEDVGATLREAGDVMVPALNAVLSGAMRASRLVAENALLALSLIARRGAAYAHTVVDAGALPNVVETMLAHTASDCALHAGISVLAHVANSNVARDGATRALLAAGALRAAVVAGQGMKACPTRNAAIVINSLVREPGFVADPACHDAVAMLGVALPCVNLGADLLSCVVTTCWDVMNFHPDSRAWLSTPQTAVALCTLMDAHGAEEDIAGPCLALVCALALFSEELRAVAMREGVLHRVHAAMCAHRGSFDVLRNACSAITVLCAGLAPDADVAAILTALKRTVTDILARYKEFEDPAATHAARVPQHLILFSLACAALRTIAAHGGCGVAAARVATILDVMGEHAGFTFLQQQCGATVAVLLNCRALVSVDGADDFIRDASRVFRQRV